VEAGTWVRLDAIGGAAGDMFVSAAVATWPELAGRIRSAVSALAIPFQYQMDWETVTRGGIVAQRFFVRADGDAAHPTGLVADIMEFIKRSDLPAPVREIAVGLFDLIATAEGKVHGIPADQVHLHELADWDSIIDMVAAAVVIDAVGPATWVCPSLPMGTGTVRCAHGVLPVPAPAVEHLCRGAQVSDDGVAGERVTPTGAAILSFLRAFQAASLPAGRLIASGYGAGTKELPGLPNVLRMLVVGREQEAHRGLQAERIAVLRFDVDDQAPEDLSIALDRLRALRGVLSVTSILMSGKKGRICFGIEILAETVFTEEIARVCFEETTTLGVRWKEEDRWKLARWDVLVESAAYGKAPVKIARRPGGGLTAKLEADFVARQDVPLQERTCMRERLEERAMKDESGGLES
jgi:hypothetical protein